MLMKKYMQFWGVNNLCYGKSIIIQFAFLKYC